MDCLSYFLFILVMTHAHATLPFPRPGYYGKRMHHMKKFIHKPAPIYPWVQPSIYHKHSVEMPFKHRYPFEKQFPYFPYKFSYAKYPHGVMATRGNHFYDNMRKGYIPFYGIYSPYSVFKSVNFPFQSFGTSPLHHRKNTNFYRRFPDMSEFAISKDKPKVLFIKSAKKPYIEPKEVPGRGIDIISGDVIDKHIPKLGQKKNRFAPEVVVINGKDSNKPKGNLDLDQFNVISLPIGDNSVPSDVITNVDASTPSDIPVPDNKIGVDVLNIDSKMTDTPNPDIQLKTPGLDPKVDLNIGTSVNDLSPPVDNINIELSTTIGDLPGFVVDGGGGAPQSDQLFIVPDLPGGIQNGNGLNGNELLIAQPGNPDVVVGGVDQLGVSVDQLGLEGSIGLVDVTSLGPLVDVGHTNVGVGDVNNIGALSDIGMVQSFGAFDQNIGHLVDIGSLGNSGDFGNIGSSDNFGIADSAIGFKRNIELNTPDINNDVIVTGSTSFEPEPRLSTDFQIDQSVQGSPGSNSIILNAEINSDNNAEARLVSPLGARAISVQSQEEDRSNQNAGSVVIVRPVSFLMNIEPFGPGPYGQCRAPARVVCGVRFGWEHVTGMAEWCRRNCVVFMYSSYCDDDRCQCECR